MLYRFTLITIIGFLSVAVVGITPLATSAETLPFKNYTTADGVPHDFVGEVFRDSRDFLWFCTGEGLSRFDGYQFKTYTQAHGLPHNSVHDLVELDGGIYVVATSDGVAIFDPKGVAANARTSEDELPMFRTVRVNFETSDNRPSSVYDLLRTRDGTVLAGTAVGLYRLVADGDQWKFERIEADVWRGKAFETFRVFEDRFGRIWIGTGLGLFIFDPSDGESYLLSNDSGLSMLEDDQGRVWSGSGITSKPGLYLFDLPDAQTRPVLLRHFTMKDGLSENIWVNALWKTSDGRILAAITNGLCEFQPDAKPGEPAFRVIFSSDITTVTEDSGGNLWVGSATRGVFKLTRHGFRLYSIEEKRPFGGVTSIFPGTGEEIFVTSSQWDLLRFDGEKFNTVRLGEIGARSWGWNQIDLRSRVDGEWWIAGAYGLVRLPAVARFQDLATVRPRKIYTTKDGLFVDEVFRLYEDSRGDIWFSVIGNTPNTLLRWERASERLHRYTTDDGLPETNAPTAFAEDAKGNLWLGFYGGGLARLRNDKFELFSARTGFPTGLVNAIRNDSQGRVWIALSSGGVVRIDDPLAEVPTFVRLTSENGLSSNQANCLTEDNFGRIYVGTGRGINRIDPTTGRIKLFTQGDGLPGGNITRCTRAENGDLWFSQKFSLARLAVLSDETAEPPPIFIGSVMINGEPARKLSELGEANVENLDFNSEQRQIQIEFFALGFGTGETLRYQYKLENADWSEPSALRTVNLNLSPGTYDFSVRAVNAEGVPSVTPARVSFAIARPIWQRWWFLLAVALGVSLLVYLFYRNRLAHAITLERVRTRLATDLHDDIGSSLSQIAILSEVARHKAGDNGAAEPLMRIADTSRDMVDSMSDIVWAINPQKDHLGDLIHRMRRFASDTFDATDVGYTFHFDETAGDIAVGADLRREIYLIFKECINNTAKYSGAERVDISIDASNDHIAVTVDDKGCGFDVAAMSAGTFDGYGGNGLVNMRKRAAALGGEFEIGSEPGRGTVVRFRIPTGRTRSGRRRKTEN